MNKNTVMKILVSGEISYSEAKSKHLQTVKDVVDYILMKDIEPSQGKLFRLDQDDLAENHADCSLNDIAEVIEFTNSGVRFLHVVFTCLEYYETDEDGDFIEGSDYDKFAEFSEEDNLKIQMFLS